MAGLFGAPLGMPGTRLGGGYAPDMRPQPTEPQKAPGIGTRLLGQGWEGKIGALGGLLRGDPNAVTNYQAMQQHQTERAEALRQASLGREAEWQDWVKREQWKRDNPDPGSPYRTEDNAGNVWEMGQDGQFKPIFVDPNDRTFLQDGQMITVPNRVRGGATPQGRTPPPEAVAELRANPALVAQFDEVFGPGAAQRALGGQGGPAPQAPGGFPR